MPDFSIPTIRRDLPPLTALIAFEAAARHLNFTSAARELNVTQPAISHQISTLEGDLGVRLFSRTGRRLSLTETGERYFDTVRASLVHIAESTRSLRLVADRGMVTIAASAGLAAYWLPPRLARLRSARRGLRLRAVTMDPAQATLPKSVDLAIRFGGGTWPSMRSSRLTYEEAFPVCAPAFSRGAIATWSPEEIWAGALVEDVRTGRDWCTWEDWRRRWCPRTRAGPQETAVGDYTVALMRALSGGGVVLGRRPMLDDQLASGDLVGARDFPVVSERGYFVVEPHDRPLRDEVRFVRDWLLEEFTTA